MIDESTRTYSLQNAKQYGWASISGNLNSERVDCLSRNIVGHRILDAGCGGGGYVHYLADQGYTATGIDFHEEFLELAASKPSRAVFLQADLNDRLPFDNGEFDTTLCFDVLEHVDDCNAIRELARVTKHRLIIAVPKKDVRNNKYLLTYYPYLDPTHLRYYTVETLNDLLQTIPTRNISIVDECRIPIEYMALKELKAQSKYPLLSPVYSWLLAFLLRRSRGPDWHVNLCAIVDLEDCCVKPD